MVSQTKHGILLVASGLVALSALSLPWVEGMTLLQIFGTIPAKGAFEGLPYTLPGRDLLIAVYTMFYCAFLSSSFLIAVGLLQYLNGPNRVTPVRRLGITLYVVSALASVYFLLTANYSVVQYGVYVFFGVLLVVLLAEYRSQNEVHQRGSSSGS